MKTLLRLLASIVFLLSAAFALALEISPTRRKRIRPASRWRFSFMPTGVQAATIERDQRHFHFLK